MRKICIRVPVKMGERSRCVLLDHEILDPGYRIFSSDGYLYIPLIKEPSSIILDQLPECAEVKEQEFEKLNKNQLLKIYWVLYPNMK